MSLRGDTLFTYATPWRPVAVPPEAKTKDVRRFPRPDGTELIGRPYLYPEHYPLIGRLLADESGYLWVMAYPVLLEPVSSDYFARAYYARVEEGGARWRVLAPGGRLVAELRTPPGLFPLEIGEDYILGVSRDELDVESVELYRLVR